MFVDKVWFPGCTSDGDLLWPFPVEGGYGSWYLGMVQVGTGCGSVSVGAVVMPGGMTYLNRGGNCGVGNMRDKLRLGMSTPQGRLIDSVPNEIEKPNGVLF